MSVSPAVAVGLGGVFGALARHVVGESLDSRRDTLAVNVLGSAALGLVTGAPLSGALALAFGTGFCGAFTTFSSFAFETVRLFETGERRAAVTNATLNLAGALLGVLVGTGVAGLLW